MNTRSVASTVVAVLGLTAGIAGAQAPPAPPAGAGGQPAYAVASPPITSPLGVYPSMYRGRLWTMRQYAGFSTAVESNRRYRYLLEQGQTGLSVAFDLPTQIGHDSDDPVAAGEVGKVGVAIDTLADVETLLDSSPLDRVSVSMTINATAPILLAMVLAVARRQGVPWDRLQGTIQNDILKEYIARGTYRFPPRPSLRLITDVFSFCSRQVPKWNTISISDYHIREAGSRPHRRSARGGRPAARGDPARPTPPRRGGRQLQPHAEQDPAGPGAEGALHARAR